MRRAIAATLIIVQALTSAGSAFGQAAPSLPSILNRSGLGRTSEIILVVSGGDSLRGTFVRYDRGEESLLLKRYRASRFTIERISLCDISQLRAVRHTYHDYYPAVGCLVGIGLGFGAGYLAGSRNNGDVGLRDTRLLFALAGGTLAGLVGLFTGAALAPADDIEEVVWTRAE